MRLFMRLDACMHIHHDYAMRPQNEFGDKFIDHLSNRYINSFVRVKKDVVLGVQ